MENNDEEIKNCNYCKNPILEGQDFIKKNGKYYHCSEDPMENCYFFEEEE
jgi:hypothetical protein